MVQQKTLASLLLGAGAGLVNAHPAPWWSVERHENHHADHVKAFSTLGSTASIPLGTGVPFGTGSIPMATGSVSTSVKKSSSSASASSAASTAASNSSSSGTATLTADSGCTFTDSDTAASSKASCSNIVLKDITVPAGETLDLSDLNDGTNVQFQGTTTFEYDEWEGPLIRFSGTSITITGASGHVIDGNGAKWWDGEGSNGGTTKPKFFYAHDMTDSTIQGLNIKNTPVQCFSVNGAENVYIKDVTIDNSAGDELDSDGDALGHNTDAFDVGSSTGVYISGANVKNQDDCLAINSGTDISFTGGTCSGGHGKKLHQIHC